MHVHTNNEYVVYYTCYAAKYTFYIARVHCTLRCCYKLYVLALNCGIVVSAWDCKNNVTVLKLQVAPLKA